MKLSFFLLVAFVQVTVSCKFCPIVNKGCPGHDLESLTLQTECECKNHCNEHADCNSISFYKTDVKSSNNCYLKNYQCRHKELINTTGTYMIKIASNKDCATELDNLKTDYCKREGKGCPGHEIESTREASLAACQRRCSANDQCKSISFYEDRRGTSLRSCYLKHHVCSDAQLLNTTGADYVKVSDNQLCTDVLFHLGSPYDYCEKQKKGCAGHDLESTHETSLRACQRRCNANNRCKAVSFYKDRIAGNTVNCYLKDYVCLNSELTVTTGDHYVKVNKGQHCQLKE